ncbi:MAG: hypothetical protein P9M14_02915 [Candidatus Alcyoniella australis]|nr:hypothetical protein [Candidatus Alcyoniella australis]
MNIAITFNVFTVWAVAAMGLVTAYQIVHLSGRAPEDRSFALFWLLFACLWFFAGLRQVFHYLGNSDMDLAIFIVVQVFLALHLIPALYFLSRRVFGKTGLTRMITIYAGLGGLLFLIFLAIDGVKFREATEFGSEWQLSTRTFIAFGCVFVAAVLMTVSDLILWGWRRIRGLDRSDTEYALIVLSIMIYETVGVADAKGLTAEWWMLAGRGLMLISALIAYFCYSWTSTQLIVVSKEVDQQMDVEGNENA